MKVLYDMFPDSPYLLRTDFDPLPGVEQVSKKLFGREGANMALLGVDGATLASTDGPYAHHKSVFQERARFALDAEGRNYQAGVFYVWEACGLGFRRGGDILDDMSKFVGHLII
jgi:glutathionylspermidine synthase